MIYITGDCHGNFERFDIENFPEQKEMTKDDYVIICGDFGFWTPSKERNEAFCNLEAHNWKVDFAVTHDGPQSIISMYSLGKIRPDETRIFLQEIQEKLDYRYWFFGHHHDNKNVTAKDIMLYEQVIQIG